jgi:hypothetical protein
MRTVTIYGRSLMVSGIAASLRGSAGLEVLQLDAAALDPVQGMSGICPDAVVVDLSVARPDLIAVLLRKHPGLLLIGVDPASDELLVLSSHSARAVSMDALLGIIEKGQWVEKP